MQVGQVVNQAVGNFVSVGESIADENPEIKNEMCEACHEARQAGKLSAKMPLVELLHTKLGLIS